MSDLSVREAEPWRDPEAVPHIQIKGVVKRYADAVAVEGVDLSIYRGELFSLLGESGCGKTTLLRILAGFVQPDEGQVIIDGQDILRLPPYERPVNMMFQSYALFPHMTVAANVAFGLRRDGVAREETKARVAAALDLVRMGPYAGRKPAQLSGGQRQRVALARSIVKRPKVLLLDEPLSALDKKLREATQFELVRIQEQVGITFIMVTHDQEEAMSMSTRIAVMNRGRIAQIGKPNELYEYPQNRFVADFVGSVNLFEGNIVQDDAEGLVVGCDEVEAGFLVSFAAPHELGSRVFAAVRPEKIRIASLEEGGVPDLPNRLRGRIVGVAYVGDMSIYRVEVDLNGQGCGRIVTVTAPNLGRWGEHSFNREQAVEIGWSADATMLLDP